MPSVNIDIEARELFDFSCEDDFNNRTIKGNIGELQVLVRLREIQVKYHKRQNYEITDQVVEKKIQEFEEFLEEAKYYPNITLFFGIKMKSDIQDDFIGFYSVPMIKYPISIRDESPIKKVDYENLNNDNLKLLKRYYREFFEAMPAYLRSGYLGIFIVDQSFYDNLSNFYILTMPSVNIDIEARELFDFSCEDDFNNRTIKGNIGELQVLVRLREIQVKYHKRQNYEITDQVVEKKIQEFEEFLEEAKYYPNITLFFGIKMKSDIQDDFIGFYSVPMIKYPISIRDESPIKKVDYENLNNDNLKLLKRYYREFFEAMPAYLRSGYLGIFIVDQSFYDNLSNFYMFVDREIILCTKENILKKFRRSSKRRIDILENVNQELKHKLKTLENRLKEKDLHSDSRYNGLSV
ncbi:hypothetical protein C2G38_2165341 [Gigaspora rosea]|uniref:Uncharacterized protein n=1 Tax=Gigaspora rosea TaxID=44941 RepID=A0A397W024_9GLOM|nr:hypothetical protein C2G38_2165341 [Gigaspora rosea]